MSVEDNHGIDLSRLIAICNFPLRTLTIECSVLLELHSTVIICAVENYTLPDVLDISWDGL